MNVAAPRIATLDFLRGVAVLGILVANLPGFALPQAAYFSPVAWGGTRSADIAMWFATFVLVEGKMRGLFAALFGASMLLVIRRADDAGDNGAAVHLRRMAALFAIGCAHLYLVWYGDILTQYALIGCVALLFVHARVRVLLLAAAAALLFATLNGLALVRAAAEPATQAAVEQAFGRPPAAMLLREIAALRGTLADGIAWRWTEDAGPVAAALFNGPETLGYMLLGMAGLRSGMLTGDWPRARYVRLAAWSLGLTMPLHVLIACHTMARHFATDAVVAASFALEAPLRPFTVAGYAALLIVVQQHGGRAAARIAAVGRTALSNYVGCSLVLAALFYGWGAGRFAGWGRAESYLLPPPLWAVMLLWPQFWLRRFGCGPLEWLWRSLIHLHPQPLRPTPVAK